MEDEGTAGLYALGIAAAATAGFIAARVNGRAALPADERVRALSLRHSGRADRVAASVASIPGFAIAYLPASLLVARELRRRGSTQAGLVPRTAVANFIVHHLAKSLIDRRRPPSQVGESNYRRSYPSGHATTVAALSLGIAYAASSGRGNRSTALAVATAAAVVGGVARVVGDRHWASDVIGGWATGTAIAAFTVARASNAGHRPALRRNARAR